MTRLEEAEDSDTDIEIDKMRARTAEKKRNWCSIRRIVGIQMWNGH